eukprot:jgi/Picre1/35751/NNA_003211.t1
MRPADSCSRYLTLDPKARDDKQIHIGGDGVSPETSTIMRAYAYYYPLYASYRALVVSSWVRRDSVGTVMNYDAPTIRSSVPRQSMAAVYSSVFLDQDKGPFRVTYPMVSPNETFLSVSILDLFTEQLLPTINNQFNSTELTGSFELHGGKKPVLGIRLEFYQSSSGWKYAIDAGQYGENYLERAYIAVNGLGATIPRDIIYASHDGLDAQYAYRMDFTADSIPETYAWSMQIYNQEGKIEKNPENIYDINSRSTALNRTEDGSVTILFQKNLPVDASAGINWMPTSGYQDGESFLPLIRFYSPGESILSREYQIPKITKYTANE